MEWSKNRSVKEKCGNEKVFLKAVDHSLLKWFGHMERIDGRGEDTSKQNTKRGMDGVSGGSVRHERR